MHSFFFFQIGVAAISVIWSGWNQIPEAILSNVAFFHMKWLFAPNPLSGSPKCTFQWSRGWPALNKKKVFWPALYKLLKAKLIFSMGNYFLIGCASFTAPMFWFFAATHASHYYLTITMQNYLRFPLQFAGYLRLCVVGGGTNEVNPPRRHQKFIMTNIMCSTLCHSNRGDASNPPKNIIRREIFAKRPPKKNSFFRAAIKKSW